MQELPLRCRCGAVTGRVRAAAPVRVVCHCAGCRAYASFLERDDLLDARGGTPILQLTPASITLSAPEGLRCVRQTPKGALRFYTPCCRTPAGNTLASARAPWVGLPDAIVDRDDLDVVAPIRWRIHGLGVGMPEGVHRTAPLSLVAWAMRRGVVDALARAHRPSPYFEGGRPVTEPRELDDAERARIGLA